MKIFSKLLVLGVVAAAAVFVDRTLVRRRGLMGPGTPPRGERGERAERERSATTTGPNAGIVEAEILGAGIADVDPEGLTQMGEAIDPEATEAAHESVTEQRERMPIRGRDIP